MAKKVKWEDMNRYWLSWWQPTKDYRPLTFPPNEQILGWWCSAEEGEYETTAFAICSVVMGTDEDDAKNAVLIDWPEADRWRFIEKMEKKDKLSDRFPITEDWIKERMI